MGRDVTFLEHLIENLGWLKQNEKLIRDLQNKRALLVIADHWEAHESISAYVDQWSQFTQFLGIPVKALMFIDDNVMSHNLHSVVTINYGTAFFFESRARTFVEECADVDVLKQIKHPTIKPKRFLSYNRHWNHYRQFAVLDMFMRDLLKHGLVSCSMCNESQPNDGFHVLKERIVDWTVNPADYDEHVMRAFNDSLPMLLGKTLTYNLATTFDLHHYLMTDFSIVNETMVDPARMFFTEKIFKAMYAKHPFILFGNPGSLRYLRNNGYQTFPFMFDESYDDIDDIRFRKDVILHSIAEWCKKSTTERSRLLDMAKDVTEHNFKILESKQGIQMRKINSQIRQAFNTLALT